MPNKRQSHRHHDYLHPTKGWKADAMIRAKALVKAQRSPLTAAIATLVQMEPVPLMLQPFRRPL